MKILPCFKFYTDFSAFNVIFFPSVPLAGKDKAVEVKCVPTLVNLLKDENVDVRANAAGALMT